MLKVLGASREKTRLTYLLLVFVIVIAVFAVFFYELPTTNNDGMYAATVTWRQHVGFKIEFWGQNNKPSAVPKGVARAYYKPDLQTNGWASIEIASSSEYPDWVQAYGAGMLEGALCWELIYRHWKNTIQLTCLDNDKCDKVREYLNQVKEAAKTHAQRSEENEPFWHHVNLFYYQLDGLIHGWKIGVDRSQRKKQIDIDDVDFLWMNSINEIRDLKLNDGSKVARKYPSLMFVKYLPNETHKFLVAHATGSSYSEMLRMHKRYTFGYHLTSAAGSALAPGNSLIFTSYPGAIHSQDDNYRIIIDGEFRMTIASANINKNSDIPLKGLSTIKELKVPYGPQAVAACRLSNNASEWTNIIKKEGGVNIGGKQWVVVDNTVSRLSMWIVEQIPRVVTASDVTYILKEKRYWVSAGIPYLEVTLRNSNINNIEPRLEAALEVLESGHENVSKPEDLLKLMRKPELIALGRADIIQYKHKDDLIRHGGIIDLKISDKSGDCISVAGPPYSEDVGPFQWSRSIIQNLPHYGQPDLWKYGPVQPTWVW